MAKVFTITQGLENMGAMKTGGQGSVYKGRRIGEIITAVKLLPTPIYSESNEDKNFRDFKNEVQKLKKVNEKPNPNIVKILSSGLSETGNFPFIEMEYIEGPDLEELLKPPHDSVFFIKEAIKVAEQLSNALAHCHSLDVKHGDVKSNNVKFNIRTGNYVLLDFGLAIMSDEQRRTSLRQAGAAEFMAPEQNEGHMLFQTDVYSFGIVLFELLAGRVPFPLQDKGETARNTVRLAHMDTLPPDIISLRKEVLPALWPQDVQAREMNIPEWLVAVIYKCLRKKPENRFANGIELHNYIRNNSVLPAEQKQTGQIKDDIQKLVKEKEQLQQQLLQYRRQINNKEKEIEELKVFINDKDQSPEAKNNSLSPVPVKKGVSVAAFTVLVFLTIGFAAFSGYSIFKNYSPAVQPSLRNDTKAPDNTVAANNLPEKADKKKENLPLKKEIQKKPVQHPDDSTEKNTVQSTIHETVPGDFSKDTQPVKQPAFEAPAKAATQYMVISKAYFYNYPDESTRRNAFVVPSNNAIISALDEQNDFVYVVFTNQLGQTSKGWLQKKDLQLLNE